MGRIGDIFLILQLWLHGKWTPSAPHPQHSTEFQKTKAVGETNNDNS